MDLKNSTILITGGTSGIGLELVKQLTALGAGIIVTGRNIEALRETKKQFPKIHTFQSDVSKPGDIESLYTEVIREFPDLNILINNAGLMRLIDLQDNTADITREIDTNLSGTIRMVDRFLPHLQTKQSAAIVNVSSGIALMTYSSAPVYSASKAGVRAYTQVLRMQLENTPVKVFEMIPPGVNTNLQNEWSVSPDPGMMMDVDKMVKVVIKGLQRDTPELKPTLISIIKLASRLMPGVLLKFGHRDFIKFKQSKK